MKPLREQALIENTAFYSRAAGKEKIDVLFGVQRSTSIEVIVSNLPPKKKAYTSHRAHSVRYFLSHWVSPYIKKANRRASALDFNRGNLMHRYSSTENIL